MPISTENAGALLGKASGVTRERKVKFLKSSSVRSLGRNSAVGEVATVSAEDARFLIAYRYAEAYTEEAEAPVTQLIAEATEVSEEVTAEDVSFEPEVVEATEESEADEDSPRRFRRRRG